MINRYKFSQWSICHQIVTRFGKRSCWRDELIRILLSRLGSDSGWFTPGALAIAELQRLFQLIGSFMHFASNPTYSPQLNVIQI
jgi:hypothetical protein